VSINEGGVPVQIDPTASTFDGDTDKDGQSDWEEIRAGTDPTSAKSLLAIQSVALNPDGARTITWSSVPGKIYQLEYKNSLNDTAWVELGGATAQGPMASISDSSTSGTAQRLYRVRLVE